MIVSKTVMSKEENRDMKKLMACLLALALLMSFGAVFAEDDLSEHVTVTMWLFPDDYEYYSDYSDNPVVQYLNGKFNMTMKFQMPPMGSEQDQFNLMLGTKQYTDIFEITYSQDNTAVLYQNGVIRDLAPFVEEYMPNFRAFLEDPANEDVKKAYLGGQ